MKITKRRIINVEQFTKLYAQNEKLYNNNTSTIL